MLLHILIGVVLVSDVNIVSPWKGVDSSFNVTAGLTPLNETAFSYGSFAPFNFWSSWNSILTDPTVSNVVTPTTCSGANCTSYFFPGGMQDISMVTNTAYTYPTNEPDLGLIVYNSPGYQVDFAPVDPSAPPFQTNNCQTYGNVIQICLTASGEDLIIGWTSM
jgi:hypothetical protein